MGYCLADVFNTGTAQAGASTTITLASGASSVDDYYNGYIVTTTGGTGLGQERLITDYVGSTRVATVPSWEVNPSSDTTYKVGLASPIYYAADGVVRVSDNTFQQLNQWFGYISDEKFDSLNADSGAIGWYNIEQSLATPTSGHCLISTPAAGSDSNGIFSSASEYIGNVIDDGGTDDVVDHSAVNLRVGVQFNKIIASGHADWDASIANYNNPSSDVPDIYPCIGTAVTKLEGTSSSQTYGAIGVDGLSYTVGENECLIASIYIKSTEYDKLSTFEIAAGGVQWNFGADKISPDTWNLLVCASDNISLGSENFPIDSETSSFLFLLRDNQSGTNDKPDYFVSGVAIADAQSIEGFQPGVYTFHHTYLYDVEHKQESLPTEFNGVDSGSEPDNVSSINVAGSSVLFNFDAYICAWSNPIAAAVDVSDHQIDHNSHGLVAGDVVRLGDMSGVSGIDTNTDYHVSSQSLETNSFRVSTNLANAIAGTSIDLSGSDDGSITYIKYNFNKRISGSRLYYKVEENDNYFLIGELDFVNKGFKFLPEADTL